jgi:ribosomal protein S6--L-glutamate ligase
MKLISFDAMRTFGIAGAVYVKPEKAHCHMSEIQQADWLLFPPYWQVNAFFYGLKKQVFPSIGSYHLGHDKVEMTRAVQLLWPRNIPETYIMANSAQARAWVLDHFEFPFVAKAIKDSMGKGVWLIQGNQDWQRYVALRDVLYVQEYLPIDRDLRLVVIGKKVVAEYWRCSAPGAFHTNVSRGGRVDFSDIPEAAVALVEEMARHLGIDHAGFDMAQVDDRIYFFEFNRLFGTVGLRNMGISAGALIGDYLASKDAPVIVPPVTRPSLGFDRAS